MARISYWNSHSGVDFFANRFMLASLSLMMNCPLANAADSGCKFKIATESGRQAAVAKAELGRQNGQMQFGLLRAGSGGILEVRFKRLGNFNRRFTPAEVIEQLNDGGEARSGFRQLKYEESLRRVKGWKFLSGVYSAQFEVSQKLFSQIGAGYLHFRLTNISESQADIDPDSSVDTSGCANIIRSL